MALEGSTPILGPFPSSGKRQLGRNMEGKEISSCTSFGSFEGKPLQFRLCHDSFKHHPSQKIPDGKSQ